MASTPIPSITLPIGNSTTGRPVAPAAGTMRFNSITQDVEVYDGTGWQTIVPVVDPQTWQEWLKKFANDLGAGLTDRRDYINRSMQERFPGSYEAVHVAGDWQLVFATPADETWFHLKYD